MEQLMTNRLIKNEVIDIADRLEHMQRIMHFQNLTINRMMQKMNKHY